MIHRLALVSKANVSADAAVWQFASVIRGARVGAGSSIGGCAIVDAAVIGDGCAIGHGAQVHPGTRIGNRVFVGPGAVFCNDRWPGVDKDGFDGEALLAGDFSTVVIEDDVSIGARVVVLPGVRIGKGATIAAGVVVERDVPAGHVLRRDGSLTRFHKRGKRARPVKELEPA